MAPHGPYLCFCSDCILTPTLVLPSWKVPVIDCIGPPMVMRDNRCISHPCLKHAVPSLCPVRDRARRSSRLGWTPRGSVLSTSELGQAPLPVRLPALEPACFFSQDRRTRSIGCYMVVTDARKELGGIFLVSLREHDCDGRGPWCPPRSLAWGFVNGNSTDNWKRTLFPFLFPHRTPIYFRL